LSLLQRELRLLLFAKEPNPLQRLENLRWAAQQKARPKKSTHDLESLNRKGPVDHTAATDHRPSRIYWLFSFAQSQAPRKVHWALLEAIPGTKLSVHSYSFDGTTCKPPIVHDSIVTNARR